ncbi:FAD-dependent monooxygenase [Streptomyces indicus]|uniref:2-polyprenyl-6-methoxyphenol hydroxylase n=1 Tax=Streptomyces indicus TaxID=417292 RepID=A0A1G9HXA0_9ACTN|nr:FAD-dependent monooxygenase [Streptomyces indicus]SDL17294.1 2-polyprenyl-6-methoxyphenol hydroxylase [Streptomyces indicus]
MSAESTSPRGTALVVGAGIGGLAAAIGLRRTGWDVTVVERAQVLADAGAGISLAANGIHALDALGVDLREAARFQYTGGTRTPDGRWLARMDGHALERALGTPIAGIPRAELHRLLRAALPPDALRVGTTVRDLDVSAPGRVRVRTDDGPFEADLLVAADGLRSRLRARLFPDHPGPVYSGSTVLRAITARPLDLAEDFALTWGPGAEFGHIAFTDGRAEWHAVLNSPAGLRHEDPLAVLRARFADWHHPVPQLLAATDPAAVLHHDIHELATPLPSFVAGRVALLGDAAHAMTPNLGQGACQALEDAVTLAAALAEGPSVESALLRYDAERRPRAQAVARAARQAGRMGQQLTNPLAIALRNRALRLAPPRATIRAILRHAAWVPPHLEREDGGGRGPRTGAAA